MINFDCPWKLPFFCDLLDSHLLYNGYYSDTPFIVAWSTNLLSSAEGFIYVSINSLRNCF